MSGTAMNEKHNCILRYLVSHIPEPYFASQWTLPANEVAEIIEKCGLSGNDELANHFQLLDQRGFLENRSSRATFGGRITVYGYEHAEAIDEKTHRLSI